MKLFDLLKIWEPSFTARDAKVHLARYNGQEHPMDVFISGNFDEWQRSQTARNFQRNFVVSLIQAGSPTSWMFAGLFSSNGYVQRCAPHSDYYYDLSRITTADEWVGRLHLTSTYKQRNSYVNGETLADDLPISELLRQRISIGHFPGYKNINLTKQQLDVVVQQNIDAWRSPLSSVKGIYLISDTRTGKLYVGKADGEEGIWARWAEYSLTTHGHNVALAREFGIETSPERQHDLRFSLLEIADLNAMPSEINARESFWKEILLSRQHGYNMN